MGVCKYKAKCTSVRCLLASSIAREMGAQLTSSCRAGRSLLTLNNASVSSSTSALTMCSLSPPFHRLRPFSACSSSWRTSASSSRSRSASGWWAASGAGSFALSLRSTKPTAGQACSSVTRSERRLASTLVPLRRLYGSFTHATPSCALRCLPQEEPRVCVLLVLHTVLLVQEEPHQREWALRAAACPWRGETK